MTLKFLGREIEKIFYKGREISQILLQNKALFEASPVGGGLCWLAFDGTTADSGPYRLPVTGAANSYCNGVKGQALDGVKTAIEVNGLTCGNQYTLEYWGWAQSNFGEEILLDLGRWSIRANVYQGQYLSVRSSYGSMSPSFPSFWNREWVNKWVHVALTVDGQILKVYIDGKYTNTPITLSAGIATSPTKLSIYAKYTKIDELKLSEGILYDGDFTPKV